MALAVPSQGATTTTSTTSRPATTSTPVSVTPGTSTTATTSSTSCYTPPPLTAYPSGTVVRAVDFEDGGIGNFYASTGVTLSNSTEVAHGGSHSLRADGLSGSAYVSTSFSAPSWGSFQVTAWVRLPAGSPPTRIRLQPSGQLVLAYADRATPVTWTSLTGKATPGTIIADWLCNGSMTGTYLPGSIGVQFSVDTSCDAGPYATSLLLDDVSMSVLTSTTATSGSTSGSWGSQPSCPSTTTTTTTSTTTASGSCQVRYRIDARWPGGFLANVEVRNTGTAAIPGWSLGWTFPDAERITQIWEATAAQNGSNVTVRPVPATSTLPAGGTARFGFLGDTGSPQPPTAFTLSGRNCSVI